MGDGKNELIAVHIITVWNDTPRSTVIECTCGYRRASSKVKDVHDPETDQAILEHRLAVIEKLVGINFSVNYGKES